MARDLSALPKTKAPTDVVSILPDRNPILGPSFIAKWIEQNDDILAPRAQAFDTPFRHSDAGACEHALAYNAMRAPITNEMSIADKWNVALGTKIHQWIEPAISAAFPGAECEVKLITGEFLGSGHSDVWLATLTWPDGSVVKVVVELKTINGFGYKSAIGVSGPAGGPKADHVTQVSLNGVAHDADYGIVWYLSRELVGKRYVKPLWSNGDEVHPLTDLGRFSAEWTYDRADMQEIADAELRRWRKIKMMVDSGDVVPRHVPGMPAKATVTSPMKGAWMAPDGSVGYTWRCEYCRYRTRCVEDLDAGR